MTVRGGARYLRFCIEARLRMFLGDGELPMLGSERS